MFEYKEILWELLDEDTLTADNVRDRLLAISQIVEECKLIADCTYKESNTYLSAELFGERIRLRLYSREEEYVYVAALKEYKADPIFIVVEDEFGETVHMRNL